LANILIFDYKERIEVKISDCGLARKISDGQCTNYGGLVGTVTHIAPEIFEATQGQTIGRSPYQPPADIYAFGITMYQVCTNANPLYPEVNNSLTLCKKVTEGGRPPIPKSMPRVIKALLVFSWHQDPERRLPASEIIKGLEGFKLKEEYSKPFSLKF